MCAAAHGWVGLGRIVYATSSAQLAGWLAELDVAPCPVRALPIREIAPDVVVEGPEPTLAAPGPRTACRLHAARPAGG